MDRRQFLQASATTALIPNVVAENSAIALRDPLPIGLAPAPKPLPKDAYVAVSNVESIKILQATDLHFFCDRKKWGPSRDQQTEDDLKRLVDRYEPDILAVTGDLWHDNPDHRGQEFFETALAKVVSLGRPWVFNWGNHDLLDDYPAAQVALTESDHSLYRGGHDGGNYRVTLTNARNEPVWELICLNTTTQGVQRQQETWLAGQIQNETPRLPSFCMLHIPLLHYDMIWKQQRAKGIRHEDVYTYGEDGSAFSYLKRLGSVKACFCGHDHVNDYGGRIDGIEMVYGRATGHAGYGGDQVKKGAKLITANARTRDYRWQSVFADGSTWTPGNS